MASKTWEDFPSTATPLDAAGLNDLEGRKLETDEVGVSVAPLSTNPADAGKAIDAHTGVSLSVVGESQLLPTVTTVSADHALALADAPNGSGVLLVTAPANVTVPPNASVAFPVGTIFEVRWHSGPGPVTLVQGAGVTIKPSTALSIAAVDTSVSIEYVGGDVWTLDAASGTGTATGRTVAKRLWLPAGAIAENLDRYRLNSQVVGSLVSGQLYLVGGAELAAGDAVNHITFVSGTVAAATPTHQWACLVDQSFNVLAKSADRTTEVWAANTSKTFDLAATFTAGADMGVYCGLVVVAATVPNLIGLLPGGNWVPFSVAPFTAVQGNSGLTDPTSLGATVTPAGVAAQNVAYARLS